MHGVKREDVVEKNEEEQAEEREKIARYKQLVKDLSLAQSPEQVLILSQQVLLMNPESYQTWNIRKKALKAIGGSALGEELMFDVEAIKLNPKSYCSWYHRKWLLTELLSSNGIVAFDWKHEMRLCVHCWNYRMFVADRFMVPLQHELDFTTEMIYSNFSNYSAWHHRTRILNKLEHVDSSLFRQTIEAGTHTCMLIIIYNVDLELCKSAIFTQPSDQAVWFYSQWLCGKSKLIKDALVGAVQELQVMEPDKHALALFFLSKHLPEKRDELLDKLITIDPMRTGLYTSCRH